MEETEAPSGPMGAGQAGSPMAAAGHMNSKMEDLGQGPQGRSRGRFLWVDLHSNFLVLSAHSTFPRGWSKEGRGGVAGLGQKEAREK